MIPLSEVIVGDILRCFWFYSAEPYYSCSSPASTWAALFLLAPIAGSVRLR